MPVCFRGRFFLGVALVCSACADDARPPNVHDDAGPTRDAAVLPDPRPVSDGGAPDATVPGDTGVKPTPVIPDAGAVDSGMPPLNDSFETAIAMEPGSPARLMDVVAAYQERYFSFVGKAGDYYSLGTERGTYSPNNVLSLYDEDHTLIAENDEGSIWPGDKVDTRLVVRLPRDGTYYAKLQDLTLPPDAFHEGFVLYYYHFGLTALTEGTPGVSFGTSDVEFKLDEASGYSYVTLVGEFRADKKGVFGFTGLENQALIGTVLASGVHGDGSTVSGGVAEVANDVGHVLAGIDRKKGQSAIHPPIPGGAYSFTMTPPTGDLGDNAFFAVDLVMLPENPPEHASTTNDTLAGAEPVAMLGSVYRRGLLIATLDAQDLDYFSFQATASETVEVACEGESAGSGIRLLQADIIDATDKVIATAQETPTENLYIEKVTVSTTGTYYLKLSSISAAPFMIDPWVRCVVNVGP